MNQAASATRRSPAGSAATASCCPMFNTPFFVNTFTPQTPLLPPPAAQPCFLGTQGSQHAQISAATNQRSQQQNVVLPNQQSVSQLSANGQSQQPVSQQPQDHSNNFSTTISPPNLSLHQLFTGRPSPTSCMALAAALAASATFPHFHHQQQQQQTTQNHQTPINQTTTNTSASNNVNPVTPANSATTTITNQVPILNFNSYSSAPPFLNLSAPAVPPTAAHLNSSTSIHHHHHHHHQQQQQQHHQQQQNSITSANQTSTPNPTAPSTAPTSANEHQQRSVLGNQVNQPQGQIYRNVQPIAQQQQQQLPQSAPVQQLGQTTRSILSDETLNNLFNDQFQAILLNQLFSNQQFAPPLATQTQPPPSQQTSAAQPASTAAARPQTLPSTGQVSVVMPPAQQIATQIISHQSSEPASDNQQQQAFQQHPISQTRIATVPPVPTINLSSGLFQPQQQTVPTNQQQQQQQATHNSIPLQVPQQTQQPTLQQQQASPPSSHNVAPQQTQPQSALPPMPFYSYPQMEQALALLTNPQVANNIFSHVFNIYLQSGLRSDPHHTHHHHHHPPHQFHHGQHHHHHHHGQNSQGNGQDATMPLDSLNINETKPRGLNRAEIDSLTPYIHMNEKDSKTCVICLSKFELKSKIRPLPCNHAFHAKCVDKWLRANRTCPICRRDALRTYNAKIKRI